MTPRKPKPQDCWLKLKGLYVKPKARFDTEEEARAASQGKRPYLCSYCGKWHLTKQPEK